MSVGVDAALSPAAGNRKIAPTIGNHAQRPYGRVRVRMGASKFVTLCRAGGVLPRPYGSIGNAVKHSRRECLVSVLILPTQAYPFARGVLR